MHKNNTFMVLRSLLLGVGLLIALPTIATVRSPVQVTLELPNSNWSASITGKESVGDYTPIGSTKKSPSGKGIVELEWGNRGRQDESKMTVTLKPSSNATKEYTVTFSYLKKNSHKKHIHLYSTSIPSKEQANLKASSWIYYTYVAEHEGHRDAKQKATYSVFVSPQQ